MTNFNTQLSALIPQAKRDDANAYLNALGFGPNNFSGEVKNPAGNVVMYGMAMPDDGRMQAALETAQPVPDGQTWADFGLTTAKVNSAVNAIKLEAKERGLTKAAAHFDAHANANNVARK